MRNAVLFNAKKAINRAGKEYEHINDPVIQSLLSATSVEEFDRIYHLKVLGYNDWTSCMVEIGGLATVSKIQVPLISMQALDDPCLPPCGTVERLYRRLPMLNENLLFVLTPTGSHIGWYKTMFGTGNIRSLRFKTLPHEILESMIDTMVGQPERAPLAVPTQTHTRPISKRKPLLNIDGVHLASMPIVQVTAV